MSDSPHDITSQPPLGDQVALSPKAAGDHAGSGEPQTRLDMMSRGKKSQLRRHSGQVDRRGQEPSDYIRMEGVIRRMPFANRIQPRPGIGGQTVLKPG